uniref:Peroxidase n=1 Tax=Ananas comosus var. bracteatus TaxID=296719 RepID=A0A6V7QVZ7_ANACO
MPRALQYGFYSGKCGNKDVEAIIQGVVSARFARDPTIVAALLRLQFHDCFVLGCDASILLDGPSSEKTAFPNLSVRGYDLIDEIKAAVEAACPGVVSCADIIIAAARDAVALAGGMPYRVPMGRRDGTVGLASNVVLPSPFMSVQQALQIYQQKGFNVFDMVLQLGAHTVGVTHCSFVDGRLYDFNGSGKPDPSMNTVLLNDLKQICPPQSSTDNIVDLDQNPTSVNRVDNSYYRQLMQNRGVLPIDQALASDPSTRWIVQLLSSTNLFPPLFNNALVKLGSSQVLTGTQGQIRKIAERYLLFSVQESGISELDTGDVKQLWTETANYPNAGQRTKRLTSLATIWWVVWTERNKIIFNDGTPNASRAIGRVVSLTKDWTEVLAP